MAIKTFTGGEVLTAANTNTFLANAGLVYIAESTFSGVTNNLANVFSATYDNYRIVFDRMSFTGTAYIVYRMLNGTTPYSATSYWSAATGLNTAGTTINVNAAGATFGYFSNQMSAATNYGAVTFDIMTPFASVRTYTTGTGINVNGAGYNSYSGGSAVDVTNSFDGIQFLGTGGQTVGGHVVVYGYRKA